VRPIEHVPDPAVPWQLPHHLVGFPVSGVELPGYPAGLRKKVAEQEARIALLTENPPLRAVMRGVADRLSRRAKRLFSGKA
jgi:hypothetical protein